MSISPPPLKRRRLSPSPRSSIPTTSSSCGVDISNHIPPALCPPSFRIVSYNVNSITHLLPSLDATKAQTPITSFFAASPKSQKQKNRTGSSGEKKGNHASASQANVYLRQRLKRWQFPDVVCLQEVKLSANDTVIQSCVQRAANPSSVARRQKDRYGKQSLTRKTANGNDDGSGIEQEDDDGDGPEYQAFFNLPTDKINARGLRGSGKVHGVCTLVRKRPQIRLSTPTGMDGGIDGGDGVLPLPQDTPDQEWTVEPVEWDHEGRCLVLTIPVSPSSITLSKSTSRPCPSVPDRRQRGLKVLNLYLPNGTDLPYYPPPSSSWKISSSKMSSSSSSSLSPSSSSPPVTTRHVYKRHFHSLLARTVYEFEQQGWTVVLAGDMNIARSAQDSFPQLRTGAPHVMNRADFERTFFNPSPSSSIHSPRTKSHAVVDDKGGHPQGDEEEAEAKETKPSLRMIDTYRHLHPTTRKYSYRPRKPGVSFGGGGDRVDMILVSGSSSSSITVSGSTRTVECDSNGGGSSSGGGSGSSTGSSNSIIQEADICDCEEERGGSDHVPVWVGLDLSFFLGQ